MLSWNLLIGCCTYSLVNISCQRNYANQIQVVKEVTINKLWKTILKEFIENQWENSSKTFNLANQSQICILKLQKEERTNGSHFRDMDSHSRYISPISHRTTLKGYRIYLQREPLEQLHSRSILKPEYSQISLGQTVLAQTLHLLN